VKGGKEKAKECKKVKKGFGGEGVSTITGGALEDARRCTVAEYKVHPPGPTAIETQKGETNLMCGSKWLGGTFRTFKSRMTKGGSKEGKKRPMCELPP